MALKFLVILSVLFFIALCIDGSYSRKTSSCDCTRIAIKKCGTSGCTKARKCRNASITSCLQRKMNAVLARKRGLRVIKKVKVSVPKRTLRRYCHKVAVETCGKGSEKKQCRKQVRAQIKKRETTFRRNVLNTCGCKTKLSKRCQKDIYASGCLRRYNRCTRRCLKKSCQIRSKLECVTQNNTTQCKKTVLNTCRRVNKVKKITVVRRRHVVKRRHHVRHVKVIVRKTVFKRNLRRYCKRVAVRKCGGRKGCARKVRIQIKRKEKKFARKLRTCGGRKTCVVRVCRVRAVRVAKRHGKGKRYVRKLVKRYTRLNCTRRARRSVRKAIRRVIRKVKVIRRRHIIKRRHHVRKVKVVVRKTVFRRNLRNYCKRVAVRKCGGRKGCARKIRVRIVKREKKFARRLRTCGGSRRCAVRVCKARAVRVAKRHGKGKRYVRKLVRRYTRINCPVRVRRTVRRAIKKSVRRVRHAVRKVKVVVRKTVFRRNLRNYCKRVAVRKCGGNGSCARKIRVRIVKREKKFARRLRSCGGSRGCAVRVCQNRAIRVAKRKGKGKTYIKKLVRRYTRINCPSRVRRTVRKAIRKVRVVKKVKVAKKAVFKRNLRSYCTRVAVRKCGGSGSCARKIKKQIQVREKKFDRKLRSCSSNSCVVRKCVTRARKVAAQKGRGQTYVKKLTQRYTAMHCKTTVRATVRATTTRSYSSSARSHSSSSSRSSSSRGGRR